MKRVITIDIDIGLIDVHVFCTVLSSGQFWLVRIPDDAGRIVDFG